MELAVRPPRRMFPALAALAAVLVALALPGSALALDTGSIGGTVTDAESEAGLRNVEVCAIDAATEEFAQCTGPDAAGAYTLEGLAPGSYYVEFWPFGSGPEYVAQFWEDAPYFVEADAVNLEAGDSVTGIDAALEVGGRVGGTVTDATDGRRLSEVIVCARRFSDDAYLICTWTEEGEYTLGGLPSGEYKIEFSPEFEGEPLDGYATQYWRGVGDIAEAEPVSVGAEPFPLGIDAALQPEEAARPPVITPPVVLPAPPPVVPPVALPVAPGPRLISPPHKRCRKGFRRRKVHGKRRCVRVKKRHPHRHRRHRHRHHS
jgi:hypothetical protein